MDNKKMNPEFARIANLAIDAYGWIEFHRDPFFVKSNEVGKQVITMASRPLASMNDVRLLACTQHIMSVEIPTIIYRIKLKYELHNERDNFICLFHTFDVRHPYKIGDSVANSFTDFNDKMLEFIG